jgi:predicted dehydrogenase
MRGLVVGLGSIGRRHARNWAWLELGRLAVCRERGLPLPEPLGVQVEEYSDLGTALEREQPDVVLVTNPTSRHIDTVCRALQAGAHVFVEKPLGDRLLDVRDLLELARTRKRVLMVAYNLRFHPGLRRLKALVDAQAIGRIVSARADVGEYLPDWHPWEDYRGGYAARRDLGGGAVLTSSHELDAMCWLLGPPRRLTAIAAHASSLQLDVEDVAEITLEFESGAIGSVHLDYVQRPPRRTYELVGEGGVLRWDYHTNRLEWYQSGMRQWRVEEGDSRYERNQMYVDELRHFAACVRGEADAPLIDGEQGAAVLAIGLAALRSSAEGRGIDFRQGADSAESANAAEESKVWLRTLGQSL